ncbi:MAG: hypothetical protein EOP42_33545 [Sphingobacteriaceae bacterium]|nr:MAG: hypothetical protein EOP42_33545 [Sphingobacteriaceae bacterium]
MQSSNLKALPLFVNWQLLQKLTQQGETTCRQQLNRFCAKYEVERLTIFQLCGEFKLTREQLQLHLSQ